MSQDNEEEDPFDDPGEIMVVDSQGNEWLWEKSKKKAAHDPMDRVGGPFRLSDFIDDNGDKFFIMTVVDCAFPLSDLVRADSFESAYEAYIDWAAKRRHLEISIEDLKDYDPEQVHMTSNGVPVDDENLKGSEVKLVKALPRVTGKTWRPRKK